MKVDNSGMYFHLIQENIDAKYSKTSMSLMSWYFFFFVFFPSNFYVKKYNYTNPKKINKHLNYF